ncbi:MAG: hypothetical protein JSS80_03210 [Bacteroidetes bacterium]|nr:hypothetical protein [Bacteroidota bacterium]
MKQKRPIITMRRLINMPARLLGGGAATYSLRLRRIQYHSSAAGGLIFLYGIEIKIYETKSPSAKLKGFK